MARRDLLTGTWSAQIRRKGRRQITTTCIDLLGDEPSCDTQRTNSIFGDLENIRFTRRGHMKADLHDDGAMLAEITIHKRFVAYTENNPGQNAYDGRLRVDTGKDRMLMFDDDIRRPWIARADYIIDL